MCMGGGGGGGIPPYVQIQMQQQQMQQERELSDRQLAAQKTISDQQLAFNQQQFDYQKQLADQQQAQANAQAARQSEYDTGRANLLGEGTKSISDAFAKFNDDYFNQYASDYMSKVQDQVQQQRTQANKQLAFGMARQGILNSQAMANQQGLLEETQGRTLADATATAQQQTEALRSNVANAKANLLGQVQASESIGSPIAASDAGGVAQALQTQRSAISGITNQAGDVSASLAGVPTVSPLSNIFASVINSAGNFLGGYQSGSGYGNFQAGLAGRRPGTGIN